MEIRSAGMGVWVAFLLSLLAWRLPSVASTACKSGDLRPACSQQGSRNPYCDQRMSRHCSERTDPPKHCYDTLGQVKEEEACRVERFWEDRECGGIKPSLITAPSESLVDLRLYHHNGSWESEALVNLTLPPRPWKELKFQYTFIGTQSMDSCREFALFERVDGTLMYDCHMKTKFGNDSMNIKLTVQSDSGQGASYLFRIPAGFRINPEKTCPGDWHVFFYIHQDALQSYEPLPLTIQSSPYGQVDYRMTLARCLHTDDKECRYFEEVDHKLVTKNTTDDVWSISLRAVNAAGYYTVRVQMVSDWCPKPKGCHVSVSPRFEVPSSPTWIILLSVTCMLLAFLASFIIMFHQRRKINKQWFEDIRRKQPPVLLVYHPESQGTLKFVKLLAEFLMKTCCVSPLMADKDVHNENPIHWTKSRMNDKIPVLFIIPKDSEAPSFTSIRNQWQVALNHCTGHEFSTNPQHTKRLAKLVLPLSGRVPCEIKDVRRFELSHNPAALANWLHGGALLDQVSLWLPHIRSSAKKNYEPTWADIKLEAQKIGSQPTAQNRDVLAPIMPSPVIMRDVGQDFNDDAASDGDESDASNDSAFDPQIPGVNNKLCESDQESSSSPDNSLDEDEMSIFQP